MRCCLSSLVRLVIHRSGLRRCHPPTRQLLLHCSTSCIHAVVCLLLTSPRYSAPVSRGPASVALSTGEISRGKTRLFHCASARFTKCTPKTADGGLRSHVPARPRCITPNIRFLFIAPQFRVRLLSDPASRRRPCRFPSLRLCENLAAGLAPT